MHVMLNITLAAGDPVPTTTPEDVLTSLGGDPTKDSISVNLSSSYNPPVPQGEPVPGVPLPK
jgi:hypothetical protein